VNIGNYSEWLRTLKAVERTTKTGIKLRNLTGIFKYEGEGMAQHPITIPEGDIYLSF